ncbi:putative peroxisomal acyl-coenzyme A oxidase 1.2 [Colletotrichum liriopes]|uniref:Peroxisomal acyl-coenzyme A oxidase 1.2 n=1 Tax=Colletotrichum liriopes TaxID=708192 RepID=A0AA37H2F3_9PEZI|nr:putative peroxisomal acyl-coenzyme A oxidase 1.2 [Colletotrichum liriopes]
MNSLGLTTRDILRLSPKFWDFHFDMISARDMTAFIVATIHLNLCIGTVASYAEGRPDLQNILDDLHSFKVCGEFMLTEVGHGLDARNLETRATLLDDGSFDLHSPSIDSAKAMPPTTPLAGIPRLAVVFARLFVSGEDRGVKPFLVNINTADGMVAGITSRALPIRPGTKPLDHSITVFDHVRIPPAALLGSMSKPANSRDEFLKQIWRVSVGTLSLSIMGVSAIKVGGYIAAKYSQARTITDSNSLGKVPIFTFKTCFETLVYGEVLDVFARWTVSEFMKPVHDTNVRMGLATVFKTMVVRSSCLLKELSERCGWQGLFSYNQFSELALMFQGNSIAEGDTLVLSIRRCPWNRKFKTGRHV